MKQSERIEAAASERSKVHRITEPPRLKFPSTSSFAEALQTATEDEWYKEEVQIRVFNEQALKFRAYVIQLPQGRGLNDYYVFRVQTSKQSQYFPAVGQACKIRMVDASHTSHWHAAETSENTLSLKNPWGGYVEFKIASFSAEGRELDEELLEEPAGTD